jgi:hypothetical protein
MHAHMQLQIHWCSLESDHIEQKEVARCKLVQASALTREVIGMVGGPAYACALVLVTLSMRIPTVGTVGLSFPKIDATLNLPYVHDERKAKSSLRCNPFAFCKQVYLE